MSKILKSMLNSTKYNLKTKPLLSGCTISSLFLGTGEFLTQILVEGRSIKFPILEYQRLPFTDYRDFGRNLKVENLTYEDRDFNHNNKKAKKVNFTIVGESMLIGFCVMAPNLFLWYRKGLPKLLNSKFLLKFSPFKRNLFVTGIDQTVFFTYWTGLFLFSHEFLAKKCPEKVIEKVKNDLVDTMRDNWYYWPGVVLFNLTFINPIFRTVFINFCGVWFNVASAVVKGRV